MVNGIRTADIIKKFEELEQYIFSFAKDFGFERFVEYDESGKNIFPSSEFEEDEELELYRNEYDDECFWDELIHRLARRDFIKTYGESSIKQMDWKERLQKEDPFVEKYADEFNRNGLEHLEIKSKATA